MAWTWVQQWTALRRPAQTEVRVKPRLVTHLLPTFLQPLRFLTSSWLTPKAAIEGLRPLTPPLPIPVHWERLDIHQPTVVSLRPRPLLAPSRGTPLPAAPQRLHRHWASSMVVTITDSLHSLLVYRVPECNHGFLDLPFHHPGHTLTHGLMDHNL